MKILLDNCVHYRAKTLFVGHDVLHARDVGWRDLSNGTLLTRAAQQFEVLATADKKIRFEHNLIALPITVLELNTRFVRWADLQTLSPFLERALSFSSAYRFISVSPDGQIETLAPK